MRGDRGWDSEGQQTSEEGTCLSQEGGAPAFLRRVRPLAATSALGTKQRPGGRKVSGLTPRSASLPDTAVELDGDRL